MTGRPLSTTLLTALALWALWLWERHRLLPAPALSPSAPLPNPPLPGAPGFPTNGAPPVLPPYAPPGGGVLGG